MIHTTGYELPGLGVLVDCSRLSLPLPTIDKKGDTLGCYLSSLVFCQNVATVLAARLKVGDLGSNIADKARQWRYLFEFA